MSVSTATPAQLKQLSDFVVMQRSICSQFAKMMNQMNSLDSSWKANVSAIIGTPTGILITDGSGLAGITQLTDTQVANMMASMESVLSTYYTSAVQQTLVQFCGPTNMT